jgi:hypothetical protein
MRSIPDISNYLNSNMIAYVQSHGMIKKYRPFNEHCVANMILYFALMNRTKGTKVQKRNKQYVILKKFSKRDVGLITSNKQDDSTLTNYCGQYTRYLLKNIKGICTNSTRYILTTDEDKKIKIKEKNKSNSDSKKSTKRKAVDILTSHKRKTIII